MKKLFNNFKARAKSCLHFSIQPLAFSLFRRPGAIALANQLGGTYQDGKQSFQIDPSTTLPVSTKYLIYKRGSSQYYVAIADGVNMPLGVSPDAAYQLSDYLSVERFGATVGTQQGLSVAAITIDHLVYSAANGLVGDLTTAGSGTYWVIGRANNTVGAANYEITFVPFFPYQLTQ